MKTLGEDVARLNQAAVIIIGFSVIAFTIIKKEYDTATLVIMTIALMFFVVVSFSLNDVFYNEDQVVLKKLFYKRVLQRSEPIKIKWYLFGIGVIRNEKESFYFITGSFRMNDSYL